MTERGQKRRQKQAISGLRAGTRLFVGEVRSFPGRLAGVALACAVTAAGVGACVLLLFSASESGFPENSPAAAAALGARNVLSLLLSLLLMCAVVVTGSTVSLWTGQRLGQFAVLRALGVTAGRLRRMVAADVARLAVLSAAVGAALGSVPLARLGRGLLVERELFPESAGLPGAGQIWATGFGVSLATGAVAVLAALASVLAAGRVSTIDLLKDPELPAAPTARGRARLLTGLAMAGLLCLPLLYVMAFMDLPGTLRAATAPGLALMVIPTLAVLAPWAVPPLTWPVRVALRVLDRRVGRIAASGMRATPARTTAIAVPVLLAVGVAVCLLGAGATMGQAVQRQTEEGLRADGVVSAEPGSRLPVTTASPAGVSATPLIATEVTAPPTDFDRRPGAARAWGADGTSLAKVLDLDARQGRLADLKEGTFAAGATRADGHHWRTGQQVRFELADGTARTLTLAAVYERDLAFPEFIIPLSTALAHTASPYAEQILLTGAVASWPAGDGRRVASRAEYLDGLNPRDPADDLAVRLIVAVVSGYALLAAANTCALAQRDRHSQRAQLRAMGLGRFQLLRCVLYEALGAAVVGIALAAVTALACLVPLAAALSAGTGGPALPAFDVPWTAGVLAAVVAAVCVPTALTARPLSGIHRQFARRAA
ncbi:FtsX-like permease family protein [Streptomyces sp. NPDC051662]|uniref:FtsX-like permease family protein n=1 Tax=Streptomyces sp. NPDC051662 TaxID=3154750 RepID=UPI0034451F00